MEEQLMSLKVDFAFKELMNNENQLSTLWT